MNVSQNNGKYRIMSEMNMIPFIDIALVLLIIFMVMTPFLVRSQIKINLPKAKTTDAPPPRQQVLTVQLDKQGVIFIEGNPVRSEAVEDQLQKRIFDPKTQPLMIEADKDVPFQYVVVVLDAAKRIGMTKLGVSVKQDQPRKPYPKKK